MPTTYWTITRLARNEDDEDVTKTATLWGIQHSSFRRSLRQRAVSTLTFRCLVADFAAEAVFGVGDTLLVRQGVQYNERGEEIAGTGTPFFYGQVAEVPRAASAESEALDYVVEDAWRALERNTFQQQTYVWDGTYQPPFFVLGNFVAKDTSHVLLPYSRSVSQGAWRVLTCEEQIREAVRWAIEEVSPGAALQIGMIEIDPDGYDGGIVPITEDRDLKCAQVITKMLRWTPDAVLWIDHSTTPPTLHCRRWSALPGVSMALGSTVFHDAQADITPLHRLVVPGVILRFEKINTLTEDGQQSSALQLTEQKWPEGITGREDGCLIQTIDLFGQQKVVQSAEVFCPTIDANHADAATRAAWWRDRDEYCANPLISDLAVEYVGRESEDSLNLPRELREGQIQDWMRYDPELKPDGVRAEEVTITARVKFILWNDEAHTSLKSDHTVAGKEVERTVRIQSTDAVSQLYTDESFTQFQEPEPAGLARFIYEGLSVLHYSGSITITEAEIASRVTLGQRLNLTGFRAEWETMNAMVVSIEDDIGNGTTSVRFGPPQYLTAQEFTDFLRTNRERSRTMSLNLPQTGRLTGGGNVNAAKILPVRNATSGPTPGGGNAVW